jgi:hypothetical protein
MQQLKMHFGGEEEDVRGNAYHDDLALQAEHIQQGVGLRDSLRHDGGSIN